MDRILFQWNQPVGERSLCERADAPLVLNPFARLWSTSVGIKEERSPINLLLLKEKY